MVVLFEARPADWSAERELAELRRVQQRYGMPMDWHPRLRGVPTIHACRVVVATRLRWPGREEAILRRLRVLAMAGEPLDDSDTFELAAEQAGVPVRELAAFCAEPEVETALRADMAAARDHACPSYELVGRADRVEQPVLRAVEDYETALGELAPDLERAPDPASAEAVLEWAGMPLATAEVAAVCDRDVADLRAQLAGTARFQPVGGDGYWSRA
jgi:hypothetical protein